MSKALVPEIVIPIIIIASVTFQTVLNRSVDYQCGNCGKDFSISPIKNILTPHSMGRKLVTCPHCGKRTWARPVRKDKDQN